MTDDAVRTATGGRYSNLAAFTDALAACEDDAKLDTMIGEAITLLHAFASPTPEPSGAEAIPRDIAEQVLSMGRVEWGATAEFDDAGHLAHLANSLRMTREHFNLEDLPVKMQGLYLTGSETVLCHTGTSPNSGPNAQALAGAWNWLHDQCLASLDAGSASS